MRVLLTYDDRIRPDSTACYFKRAFEAILGKDSILHLYPEQLGNAPKDCDFYLKIDDGLSWHEFPADLHPSGYYIIDCHIDLEWRRKIAQKAGFDWCFFAQKSPSDVEWFGAKRLWVPLAAEESSHYNPATSKKYDVAFIGNFHSQYAQKRLDLCDALFKAFPEFYFGTRFFTDMANKFSESRLVWNKSLNDDINMRFFEAQMSGAALLTDRIPEISELGYKDGIHYIGYDSSEEMIEKAKFYLKNAAEREMIAFNGYWHTKRKHQYRHRAVQILEAIRSREEAKI